MTMLAGQRGADPKERHVAKTIDEKIGATAEKLDITQYEAAMREYLEQSKLEGKAKRAKEKLKEKIKSYLARVGDRAVAGVEALPDGKVPVAYFYEQEQPKWDKDVAMQLLEPATLAKILSMVKVECFTVSAMESDVASDLVERTNSNGEGEEPSKPSTER
jgi:hypothetical protein